jgi:hypothetical protein
MSEPAVTSRLATVRAAGLVCASLAAAALTWRLRPAGAGRDPVAETVLGCAWLAWLLAGWLSCSVAVCAAAHLLGRRGTRETAQRYVPRRLNRLVDAVITAGLVGAVIGGAVVPATAAAAPTSATASSHRVLGGDPLDWPGLTAEPSASRLPAAQHHPTHRLAPEPGRAHRPPAHVGLVSATPSRAGEPDPVVTVRPGDSLWSLAAADLGRDATPAQIAAAWPRWYAANRGVIGNDPTLIRPGQRLRPPGGRATNPTRHHPRRSSP